MPEPTFSQPERRSLLVPIMIALAALAVAAGIAVHFYPATTVNIAHVRSALLPTSTHFQSGTNVVGASRDETQLYIAETLRVDNQLRVPIFLDDFSLTLTNPDGAEMVVKASQKDELPNLEQSFPALKPLATKSLLRETSIEPKHAVDGTIVFSVPVPESMWAARKSAVIKVDLYHQPSLYVTIPKA